MIEDKVCLIFLSDKFLKEKQVFLTRDYVIYVLNLR